MTILLMLACVGPNGEWAEELFIGESTTITLDANDLCRGANCAWDQVEELVDVIVDHPEVLEVSFGETTSADFLATGTGSTKVTFIGLDEENQVAERYVDVTVARISKTSVNPRCNVHEPDEDVFLVPPSAEIRFWWSLMDSDYNELAGDPGLDFGTFDVIELDEVDGYALLDAPAEAGEVLVEAAVLDRPLATFEVYDAGSDGLDAYALFGTLIEMDETLWIETALQFDGRSACIDEAQRTVTVLTPSVCTLSSEVEMHEAVISDTSFHIWPLSSGECIFEVEADGHSVEMTASVL